MAITEQTELTRGGHITEDLAKYIVSTTDEGWRQAVRFQFPNGHGASVINLGDLASALGFELAVLDREGCLDYSTEITDDVLPGLSGQEITDYLYRIMAL